jgi:hypothetical protein
MTSAQLKLLEAVTRSIMVLLASGQTIARQQRDEQTQELMRALEAVKDQNA